MAASGGRRLQLVIFGHSKAGKATTVGHFKYLCGGVSLRDLETYKRDVAATGKVSYKYAWVFDNLLKNREEHESTEPMGQIITQHTKFDILEAVGHRNFVRNLMKSESTVDVALLVVSACEGEFENGGLSETVEQIRLLATLGVRMVVVTINKMDDKNVAYREARYQSVEQSVRAEFESFGIIKERIHFLPISAWTGENMIEPSKALAWWKGPTLMGALERALALPDPPILPFRLSISELSENNTSSATVVGDVLSGEIGLGAIVVCSPSQTTATVASVQEPILEALSEKKRTLTLELHINELRGEPAPGNVIGLCTDNPPSVTHQFVAYVSFLTDYGELKDDNLLSVRCCNFRTTSSKHKIISQFDPCTGAFKRSSSLTIRKGDVALLEVCTQDEACVEVFAMHSLLGRIAVFDGDRQVAFGIVQDIRPSE